MGTDERAGLDFLTGRTMNTPPDNSLRNKAVFVGMLVLGVVVTVVAFFLSNSGLVIIGLLLALVGGLGWLSTR